MKIKDVKVGRLYKLRLDPQDCFSGKFEDEQVFLCIEPDPHGGGCQYFLPCKPNPIRMNALSDGDCSEVIVVTRKVLDDFGMEIAKLSSGYGELMYHLVYKGATHPKGYKTYGGAYAHATRVVKEELKND